jgi:hypothetical protein
VPPLTMRGRQVRTSLYDPAMVAQLAVAVLAVGTLWFAVSILDLPSRTEVTVVNSSDYDIDVAVHGQDESALTLFGRVDRGETRTQARLLDPGDDWVFVFRQGGTDLGELRLTRGELDDLDHTVDIPPEVISRARSQGLTPSPQ